MHNYGFNTAVPPRLSAKRESVPRFTAGNPYPRPLSHGEVYAVDFEDPNHPLNAQNWPSFKKYTFESMEEEQGLPKFGAGKRYPRPLPQSEDYVVDFDGPNDPLNAQNWPMFKKYTNINPFGPEKKNKANILSRLYIGGIVAFVALSTAAASSIFSPAIVDVSDEFDVSPEVGTLGTSLFVLGFAFGPLMWAPMSEAFGRRLPMMAATFGFAIFAIAVAVAKDLQTIIICRYFGGLFGSCPLVVVAAIYADMFDNRLRGLAIAVFGAVAACGPFIAPFIGGFIADSSLGWRCKFSVCYLNGNVESCG